MNTLPYRQVKKVLSVNADAKTIKGSSLGVLTGVLYFAPHTISGFQMCPKATAGCMAACLYTAGRGIYNNTQQSRINKTKWFMLNRPEFMQTLVKDVKSLIRKAKKAKMIPAVRLNGTSDIAWEKISVTVDGVSYRNMMAAFPNVEFYDYTRILGRKLALQTPNYHLTFSLGESNDSDAIKALTEGYNLSVVMRIGRNEIKPKMWSGYPVIDGDKTDVRFMDPKGGHVVGLFPKGKGRYDKSGFVREINASMT